MAVTIEIQDGKQPNNVVLVEREKHNTKLKACPMILRRIVFWIGDVIWPDWYNTENGKKAYLGYADKVEDGELSVCNKYFFDVAWPRIQKHLEADGIAIIRITPEG